MLDIIGAIFIIVIGTILHFLYDWTNHNKIVGYFTAVNESTWEHLKLILAPSFIWLIVEYHFYYNNPIYPFARFISILTMLIIIPVIFYLYTGITKKNSFIVNILSFIIAPIIGQIVFRTILNTNNSNLLLNHIGIIGLILIFLRYMTHTYVPDKNFIHKDPITNKYGIAGHYHEKKKK